MQDEHVNLIASDFNGAAWRQTNGNNSHQTSTLQEAFADTDFPMPPGPTPLWGPGAIPGEWADVCGFIVPPNSHDLWKVRLHEAFTITREILGLSQRDQSCHHEVWLHLDFVGDRYAHGSRKNHDHRIHLKEKSRPTHLPRKEEGRMTEVTIHSHLCRRHDLAFHLPNRLKKKERQNYMSGFWLVFLSR